MKTEQFHPFLITAFSKFVLTSSILVTMLIVGIFVGFFLGLALVASLQYGMHLRSSDRSRKVCLLSSYLQYALFIVFLFAKSGML